MNNEKYTIKQIEKLLAEKTPELWEASSNEPFYIDLRKPAPSLSKHDDIRPTYWLPQDAKFVLWCANGGVQMLLDRIKELNEDIAFMGMKKE